LDDFFCGGCVYGGGIIEPVVAELVNYRSGGCIRAVAAEVVAAELAVWG
jgi:hypothetical protein